MKKTIPILLALILLLTTAGCGDYGTPRQQYPYTLKEGELTVSSTNPVHTVYADSRELWSPGIDRIHTVIFDGTVESIGDGAFQDYPVLETVQFHDGITEIRTEAFEGCPLILQELPKNLESIGRRAFAGCTVPETLVIPASVESIDIQAFKDVKGLKTVILEGNTDLEREVFAGTELCEVILPENYTGTDYSSLAACTNLTQVTVPDGTRLCPNFRGCIYLQKVTLPASVEKVRMRDFMGCSGLTEVVFLGATEIGEQSFSGCSSLKSITVHEGVESLGYLAFENCTALETIYIPTTMRRILPTSFTGCTGLKEIHYAGTQEEWNQVNNEEFNELYGHLLIFESPAP